MVHCFLWKWDLFESFFTKMRPFWFIFSWKWDHFDSFFTERRPFWFIFHRNDTFLLHFSWKWDLFGSFFMKMIHFGSIFTKMGPFEDPYYSSCNCCVSHFSIKIGAFFHLLQYINENKALIFNQKWENYRCCFCWVIPGSAVAFT